MQTLWKNIERWFEKHTGKVLITAAVVVGAGLIVYLYFAACKASCGFDLIEAIGEEGTRNLIILLAGIIGWYFLNRRTKTAEQDLVTDRLGLAMQHLANEDSSIRVGGILGLEQIAQSQEEESRKIAQILLSFIRKRDKEYPTKGPQPKDETEDAHKKSLFAYRIERLDLEAAVNALAHIAANLEYKNQYGEFKFHLCDLQEVDLRGLRLVEANLSGFNFSKSNLSGAWLRQADLSNANLKNVNLQYAYLSGANLQDAKGLTQEQLDQAFADEAFPPDLPSGFNPPPPEKDNPDITR